MIGDFFDCVMNWSCFVFLLISKAPSISTGAGVRFERGIVERLVLFIRPQVCR